MSVHESHKKEEAAIAIIVMTITTIAWFQLLILMPFL